MAGSVTTTHYPPSRQIGRIVFEATGDAADGTIPNTVLPAFEGFLTALVTNPGSTGPTANYDITLTDAEGADRLQALGINRHTSNTEQVGIFYSGTSQHPPVQLGEALTLTFANTSVNSATVKVVLYYQTSA